MTEILEILSFGDNSRMWLTICWASLMAAANRSVRTPVKSAPRTCSVADKGDAYGFVIFSVRVSVETALAFTASGVKRRSSQPFCE